MKRTTVLAMVLAACSMTGCAGGYGYGGYSYYAPTAPPPVRVEVAGVAPGPGFAWVRGYWGYRGGGYAWVPGYWGRPPRPRAVWEAGRWERRGSRYGYREGRWR
jgi:hypothetical protein